MDFIKKHKKGLIITLVILILLILVVIVIHSLMPDTSKSVWGNRLEEIEKHPIDDESINKLKEVIINDPKASDVTYRLSGRTMNFIITVEDGVARSDAQTLVNYIIENLSDDIKGYYDIEVYFKTNTEDASYPFIAYKHKTRTHFRFTYAG